MPYLNLVSWNLKAFSGSAYYGKTWCKRVVLGPQIILQLFCHNSNKGITV